MNQENLNWKFSRLSEMHGKFMNEEKKFIKFKLRIYTLFVHGASLKSFFLLAPLSAKKIDKVNEL